MRRPTIVMILIDAKTNSASPTYVEVVSDVITAVHAHREHTIDSDSKYVQAKHQYNDDGNPSRNIDIFRSVPELHDSTRSRDLSA